MSPLQQHYQAATSKEDFTNSPEQVVDRINDWVNDQTEGRIEKILEQLNPEEVLFLVNALYFIGDWAEPFPEETTADRDFQLRDGRTISVPTMTQDKELRVLLQESYAAVELAFNDSDYAMQFVLPSAGTDIIDWLSAGRLANIHQSIKNEAQVQRVLLSLPKFKVDYKITLNETLKALGMEVAFEPAAADFSKIGSFIQGKPYISRVEHKTFLEIDEKGAEGAAVTAVSIDVTSAPPAIEFNRPFMTQLIHQPSKTSVFSGIIQNPVEEN